MEARQITPTEIDIAVHQAEAIRSAYVAKSCRAIFKRIIETADQYKATRDQLANQR